MDSTTARNDTQTSTEADPERLEQLFEAQRERALALRTSTAAERIAKLKRLRALLFEKRGEIVAACDADFAKPAAEVDVTEILPVVAEARHAIRHLKGWMKPRRKRPGLLMLGTTAEVRTEPKGVCLIISPWNYPVNLSFGPLVSAIAAGNTVILKPSEMTPHCAAVMQSFIEQLFDPAEVAVVQGAAATSKRLLAMAFDHIFFTGSPAIGRAVMAAAAEHLASVTLELGGKSPAIVDHSAKLDAAAESLVWGKFANNGQTCIAPDYVYVHNTIKDDFIAACRKAIKNLYGDTSQLADNSDYCRIVNEPHFERLRGLLDDAVTRGATLAVGEKPEPSDRFMPPTLLTDVDDGARILDEEIFGPILPIRPFNDIDIPIAAINAAPKPLALYVFATDNNQVERVLSRTSAGGSCVNQVMMHFLHPRLPFGGVNNSGLGRSHGHYGYLAFSHERAVLRDRFSGAALFRPPYSRPKRWLIRFAVRWLS